MPAGLQVWNDASYTQIDGSTTHAVLLRSGTATTTTFQPGVALDPNNYSQCAIPLNPGEILAWSGGAACTFAGVSSGLAYLHAMAAPGSGIPYWVFGAYQPSGINYGLQIFNEAGQMIYDSGRLPIRVVGEVSGVGTFSGYAPGRTLALVPWSQHCVFNRSTGTAPQGGTIIATDLTAGFARADSGGNVVIAEAQYMRSLYTIHNTDPVDLGPNPIDNLSPNKYTVLDVTGY